MGKRLAIPIAVALAALALTHAGSGASGERSATTLDGRVGTGDGPLAGAVVRIQATDNQTVSAADGTFVLVGLDPAVPVTVTAWAEGYFVAWIEAVPGDPVVSLTLRRYPLTDDPARNWMSIEGAAGSASCGRCMPALYEQWQGDAHAGSAVNPRFLTMYRGTDMDGNQSPPPRHATDPDYGRVALPPDTTRPYHGPGYKLDFPDTAGNCAACHVPAMAAWPAYEYEADVNEVSGIAAEGVFCEFCHKIGAVTLDEGSGLPQPNMPGVLSMRLHRPDDGEELFFGTLDDVTRRVSRLPLQEESAVCAPCHFGVFWDTVVYNSYGEWLESPYADPETGQSCQDCHMPDTDATTIALPEEGGLERAGGGISDHRMPGASDVELLQDTALLTVEALRDGQRVEVTVRVTNDQAGHHLPTGHPARNVLLVVLAKDRDGEPLPLAAGPTIPAWGGAGDGPDDHAGKPGRAYAKVLQERRTGVFPSAAYWNPTVVREDTRIPAMAADVTRYEFLVPPGRLPATVTARLLFRRAFAELAQQKGWDDPDIPMESAQVTVR